ADGRVPIERRLPAVLHGLEAAAAAQRTERLEREQRHRRWEEERLSAEKERERREFETWRGGQLLKLIASWETARRIRRFARAAQRARTVSDIQLAWLHGLADRADPMASLPGSRIWSADPRVRFNGE